MANTRQGSVPVDENGAVPVAVSSATVTLTTSDVEIGAVELKNATTDDRAAISAAGALKVDGSAATQPISGTVTVQDGGNVISVDDGGASLTVDGTVAVSGAVPVTDNGGSLTVDGTFWQATQPVSGTVTANAGTGDRSTVGNVAHDGVDSGNPVKIGGQANDNERTAVAAGDRVDAWFDTKGRLVTVANHPNDATPVTATITATTNTQIIATPGAGQSLHVENLMVSNGSATLTRLDIVEGGTAGASDGTIRCSMWLAANGGGFHRQFKGFWKLAANTALFARLSTGVTDVRVNVEYFTAP